MSAARGCESELPRIPSRRVAMDAGSMAGEIALIACGVVLLTTYQFVALRARAGIVVSYAKDWPNLPGRWRQTLPVLGFCLILGGAIAISIWMFLLGVALSMAAAFAPIWLHNRRARSLRSHV